MSNSIERTVSIDAEPGVVYDALTSPELLGKWLCHEADVDGNVGGNCQFRWATDDIGAKVRYDASAEIFELDPGKRLRLRLAASSGATASEISIELSPSDGKTELHLTHDGFGDSAPSGDAHDSYSRGWTASLAALCSLIEDDPEERIHPAVMERTITLRGHDPCGMTWQDGALWVSDSGGSISRLNPRTGVAETSFEFDGEPSGLAFDGEALWQADREDGVLVKLDVATGRVMKRMQIDGLHGELTGLCWDGSHLWVGDAGDEKGAILRIHPRTGIADKTYEITPSIAGLTFDGEMLWIADFEARCLLRIDRQTAKASSRVSVKGHPTGLAWDGERIWYADSEWKLGCRILEDMR